MGKWQSASDIGGTFTDVAYIDKDCMLRTAKVPSTPSNYGSGVLRGLQVLGGDELPLSSLEQMVHGCTVATNAILEGKGAKTALLTTKGFRDVLELRRIRVPKLYDPLYVKPTPLTLRNLRFEVTERVGGQGEVVIPLQEDELQQIAKAIVEAKVEAVAVCFLHSYLNPEHERRVGELLRTLLPSHIFVTLSIDVLPQIREYERTSTTVVNAYVGPVVSSYFDGMDADLRKADCSARISVMQSSGGVVDVSSVKEKPAQIVECGPAAGVVGAAWLANKLGEPNLITFDMGGTTAKGSMIENGKVIYAEDYEVGGSISTVGASGGGYALKLPVIDISEVGAGGGSYVWLDMANAIKVGPHSAGAVPGPACYNAGGSRPTVTDANVVLGFLSQSALAGGTVPVDAALSRQALQTVIADPLGMPLLQAAYGVHQVANATMVRAIKAVTTYRGRDPREFSLVAFGGNGGVHGVGIARSLEIKKIIIPPAAGVFSAVGLLLAEKSVTVSAAFIGLLHEIDGTKAEEAIERLKADGNRLLGIQKGSADYVLSMEMRYIGQAFELVVDCTEHSFTYLDAKKLRAQFDSEYAQRFGHSFGEDQAVEVVALRIKAIDTSYIPPAALALPKRSKPTIQRKVWFGDEFGEHLTDVIERSQLTQTPRQGPVIIEEYEGTTVVPPDATCCCDALSNIVVLFED